ncbi:MAG: hypothetical protein K2I86_03660 [Prevotella sp.]|nr:hypothetical protein [Prevotella sp.]
MVPIGFAHGAEPLRASCGVPRRGVNTGSGRGAERLRMGSAASADGRRAGVLMIKGGRP